MKTRTLGSVVVIVALCANFAFADLSPVAFRIEATNIAGSGSFEVPAASLQYNPQTQTYTWSQQTPLDLRSGTGALIATLEEASLTYVEDPQVNLSFAVTAGMNTTTFTIQSALLSFPTINSPEGRASAAFAITDVNGDGATLTGLSNPGSFLAQYNGFVPNGTTFANLISSITAMPGGSNNAAVTDPATGYRTIGVPVSDMSSQISFSLTAQDLASGTTNYEIVPEPAAMTLLALGALAFVRRR